MKIKVILCVCTALIWALGSQSAKAEILYQGWQEFAFSATDDFDCAGEDGVDLPSVPRKSPTVNGLELTPRNLENWK